MLDSELAVVMSLPSKSPSRLTAQSSTRSARTQILVWRILLGACLLAAADCARPIRPQPPRDRTFASFTVSAYCRGTITAAGSKPAHGVAAADPSVLPIGSRIRVAGLETRYNGVYTVLDTGSNVQGRQIDLYIRDCQEAIRFGRRSAQVSILRRGR
jgi:3D (Asp-Asp-Asp) domain-containing protein